MHKKTEIGVNVRQSQNIRHTSFKILKCQELGFRVRINLV